MHRARGVLATLLALLAVLCALAAVVAVWGRGQILDTDRYLASVAPLADDPVIQAEVADKIAEAIIARLDVEQYAAGVLGPEAASLAPALARGVTDWVGDTARDVVSSRQFARLWTAANRIGHAELVRLLTGEEPPGVVISAGRIQVDLTDMVAVVRGRLVAAGLSVVATIPPITLVVDIADADGLTAARDAVRLLDRLAWWLPVAALVLIAAAALAATSRRRVAVRTLVAVAWAMVLLRLVIALGKRIAADSIPREIATPTAVHHYYDHLLRLLERGVLGAALVAGILLLVVAATAVDVRRRRVPATYVAAGLGVLAAVLVILGWGHVLVVVLGLLLAAAGIAVARGSREGAVKSG
ncbi:hypothetical protein [Nocardioides humi]|uniref:Uncharacterized protein n=1 Tax=Nocardioides humi TaxID=449461 RepID=A0ABN2A381_9ACTN|nr:hypothetical protein [Nocardioides humi]